MEPEKIIEQILADANNSRIKYGYKQLADLIEEYKKNQEAFPASIVSLETELNDLISEGENLKSPEDKQLNERLQIVKRSEINLRRCTYSYFNPRIITGLEDLYAKKPAWDKG